MAGWWSEQVVPRLVDTCLGNAEVHELRALVCQGLHGEVVEIGFGSGLNVRHYPPAVTRVSAVEPSDVAWRAALPRLGASTVDVRREGLDGERLDLPDASYDAALSTFTMCTIPDLDAALAELRRVLRPGGRLHFAEHGLAPSAGVARWQHRIEPFQRRVFAGCHLTRPIAERVERAGFTIGDLERFYAPGPKPFSHLYLGWATAP